MNLKAKPTVPEKAFAPAATKPALATVREGVAVLRPQECAERLRCHVDQIYDLVEEGELRAIDISGRNNLSDRRCLRIPVESWDAFLAARAT